MLASLNHPNIAQIYGMEARALVMELVEGETLRVSTHRDGTAPRTTDFRSITSRNQNPGEAPQPDGAPAANQLIDKHLAEAGVLSPPAMVVNLVNTQIALVEAGEGIAVVPSYALPACRNRRVVMSRLIHPNVTLDFHQIRKRGRKLPPVADEFTAYCRDIPSSRCLAGSFGASPLLSNFLYGVKAHDPMTLALVSLFLIGVTVLATYIPAVRVLSQMQSSVAKSAADFQPRLTRRYPGLD